MKVKQITLGSSTLVLAVLLTACGGSSSSGVQKPTPLVANTNNSGNHGTTNHGNHGATNHGNHGANNHGHHGHHNTTNSGATISYASFKNRAIKEAKDYVHKKDGVVPEITGYTLSVDGKAQDGDLNLSKYPKGHSTLNVKETLTGEVKGKSDSITTDYAVYLFKQDYSLITGVYNKNVTTVLNGHTETKPIGAYFLTRTRGTLTEKLPTTGKFNYSGSGKVGSQSGVQEVNFNYNVDFGAKTGSGSLGNITLLEGNIKNHVIDGKATAAGSLGGHYRVGIFGPDADEIAGKVELGNDKEHMFGIFGGTKQAK